ncbi:Uncharacterized protein APZ42_004529, partial [Daphnia magna]
EMNSHSTEANERRRKRALTMRKSLMASSSITEVKDNASLSPSCNSGVVSRQ